MQTLPASEHFPSNAQEVPGSDEQRRFLVTAPEAHRLLKNESVMVVDVRTNEAFNVCRIPGAVNLSLATLRGLRELPGGRIICYDSGLDDSKTARVLEEKSKELDEPILLLSGGLRNWIQWGGAVEGQRADDPAESMIVSPTAPEIKNCTKLLLLDEEGFVPIEVANLPELVVLKKSDLPDFLSQLRMTSGTGTSSVVLMTRGGFGYSDIKLEYHSGQAVFGFEGGFEDYLSSRKMYEPSGESKIVSRRSQSDGENGTSGRSLPWRCVPCEESNGGKSMPNQ